MRPSPSPSKHEILSQFLCPPFFSRTQRPRLARCPWRAIVFVCSETWSLSLIASPFYICKPRDRIWSYSTLRLHPSFWKWSNIHGLPRSSIPRGGGGGIVVGVDERMTGDKRNILDNHRRQLAEKFELKRRLYKAFCYDPTLPPDVREEHRYKLSKLPRNSSFTRLRNRCIFTGRPRSVYQLFRVSRIVFRDLASRGLLMGVKKASW